MGEIAHDDEHFFPPFPSYLSITSVWSISLSDGEIKYLYPCKCMNQNILLWLDNKRYIAYEGFFDAMEVVQSFRLVDTENSTARVLYDGNFVQQTFDPIHETFAIYQLDSPEHPQGIYLVSTGNSAVRYLDNSSYPRDLPNWDEETGLFLSEEECEDNPSGFRAFDYLGNFKCVPKPTPTATPTPTVSEIYAAPDGKSVVASKLDGVWLKADGKTAVKIHPKAASQVLWCPNSSCFFFFAPQDEHTWALYHVSVPNMVIKMVDEGIATGQSGQWLGSENP
jgi:hypothetical protein